MGGQTRGLAMSVLQNDPTAKAVLWSDVCASVHCEGQSYHMEQAKGNEANYLIDACLVEHIESVDLPKFSHAPLMLLLKNALPRQYVINMVYGRAP